MSNYILKMVKVVESCQTWNAFENSTWSGQVVSKILNLSYMDFMVYCTVVKTFIQMWQCLYSRFLLPFITTIFSYKMLERAK